MNKRCLKQVNCWDDDDDDDSDNCDNDDDDDDGDDDDVHPSQLQLSV